MLLVARPRRMCCSRAQREHVAGLPVFICCLAGDASGRFAHVVETHREETQVGSAKVERIAQALAFTHNDVGAILARRCEHAEADRVDCHCQQRAFGMYGVG